MRRQLVNSIGLSHQGSFRVVLENCESVEPTCVVLPGLNQASPEDILLLFSSKVTKRCLLPLKL